MNQNVPPESTPGQDDWLQNSTRGLLIVNPEVDNGEADELLDSHGFPYVRAFGERLRHPILKSRRERLVGLAAIAEYLTSDSESRAAARVD